MIAAELPDGSVVASKSIAYVKDSLPGWPWRSTLDERSSDSDVQYWLDNGTAAVLRVGAEPDWQWGVRHYLGGVKDHAWSSGRKARHQVSALRAEGYKTELIRRPVQRAAGEWQVVGEPETEAADG